jgi:AraC-like DNA-binding protein
MDFWFFAYAAGSLQAALLAITLWQRRTRRAESQVLAIWLVVIAIDLGVRAWALSQPALAAYKPMRFVSLLPFLHGSLFYLYARAVIRDRGLRWGDLWHAGGFLIAAVTNGARLLLDAETLQAMLAAGTAYRSVLPDATLFFYSMGYITAATVMIRRHREHLCNTRSDTHPNALRWLVVVSLCQYVIWSIALLQWLLPQSGISPRLIYVAVAAFVLVVGYASLLHRGDTLEAVEQPAMASVAAEPPATADPGPSTADPAADDPRVDAVLLRLQQLMETEALYCQPALNIAALARRSGYPEYLVSAVINRRIGKPFWDYVNSYRVEAVRARLRDPGESRTALQLAYDHGFTSKSTFNAAFKRLLGQTPSECRALSGVAPSGVAGTTPPAAG